MRRTDSPAARRGKDARRRGLITADDFRQSVDQALITWGVLAVIAILGALFFLSLLLGCVLYAAANGA